MSQYESVCHSNMFLYTRWIFNTTLLNLLDSFNQLHMWFYRKIQPEFQSSFLSQFPSTHVLEWSRYENFSEYLFCPKIFCTRHEKNVKFFWSTFPQNCIEWHSKLQETMLGLFSIQFVPWLTQFYLFVSTFHCNVTFMFQPFIAMLF